MAEAEEVLEQRGVEDRGTQALLIIDKPITKEEAKARNQQLVSDSLVREEDAPLSQSSLDLPAYFAGAKISHVQPLHAPCPAGHRT